MQQRNENENRRIHLVRHGEVENPDGILYGRLPGFHLSERGAGMAVVAATALRDQGRSVARLLSSPLERAKESAAPFSTIFDREIEVREGLTEASSKLQGQRVSMSLSIVAKPAVWRYLFNPFRPSWGESFRSVAERMRLELEHAATLLSDEDGDVVLVSHQLPIWMAHRSIAERSLFHDPRKRRCTLSSVTSFEVVDGSLVEVDYQEPAVDLGAGSKDVGAV